MKNKENGLAWMLIGLVAFVVRAIYILESRSGPSFDLPIVDAATYVDHARALAGGAPVNEHLFWQPVFYPVYLAAVFRLTGGHFLAAKLLQALLGALACLGTALLAGRLLGRRAGLAAGGLLAFYGPAIAIEAEFLSEGWALFWAILLLWGFILAPSTARPAAWWALGAASGLACLTRPNFIPFVVLASLWALVLTIRARGRRAGLDLGRALLVGLLLPLLPAAMWSRQHTGRFTILPSSSGLNLYLGNNTNWPRTVVIRPGREWAALFDEAVQAGYPGLWGSSDYFRNKTARFIRERPGAFLAGLFQKSARFVHSRELPRNHDLYLARTWSVLIRPLLWKSRGFGFPFGVLGPLALLGLWRLRKRLPAALWLFLLLYPASVILVFVSDRYRLPVAPLLAILAAEGIQFLWRGILARDMRRVAIVAVLLACAGWAISRPVRFPEEEVVYEGEFHWGIGRRLAQEGRPREAEEHLRKALELNPGLTDGWTDLATLAERDGRVEDALSCYRRAVELAPSDGRLRFNLGAALWEAGFMDEARVELRHALALRPDDAELRRRVERMNPRRSSL